MGLSALSGNSGLSLVKVEPSPSDASVPFLGAFQGGMTNTTIGLKAKMSSATKVRLVYSQNADLSNPVFTSWRDTQADSIVALFDLTGLKPSTVYYWAIEIGGKRSTLTGKFKTTPVPLSASSFKFCVTGCADTASAHVAFDQIAALDIDFFIHLGDLHYLDIGNNNPSQFRNAYNQVLGITGQSNLFRKHSTQYLYDDHDFAGNDSDGTRVAKTACGQVYREYVATYPLPADGSGYVAFTIGRFLFIHTDNRFNKTPNLDPDGVSKTVLGSVQKQWFKDTCLAAKATHKGIFWVESFTFNGTADGTSDNWAGYPTERAELCEFFRTNNIPLVAILCGDAHMLAYDNGSSNAWDSLGVSPGCPVIQSAPLDQVGSSKGGTFSSGTNQNALGTGQYSVIEVQETASYTRFFVNGYNSANPSTPILTHSFFNVVWEAYHDCYGNTAGAAQLAKVTNGGYVQNTASPVYVALKNFRLGTTLPVEVQCSWATSGLYSTTTVGSGTTTINTEYRNTFRNRINLTYQVAEIGSVSSRAFIDIRNLDPTKKYLIAMSCDRGDSNNPGGRWLRVNLNNALNVENLSTPGIMVYSTTAVGFSSYYNTVLGYVARWIFNPSAAGTIQIEQQYDPAIASTTKAHPIKALQLAELA